MAKESSSPVYSIQEQGYRLIGLEQKLLSSGGLRILVIYVLSSLSTFSLLY